MLKLCNTRLLLISLCFFVSGCVTWNTGLKPTNPSYGFFTWSTAVSSLQPTFAWKPYDDIDGKENIRYQLVILDEEEAVIVGEDNLREPSYTPGAPLKANTKYQWHVRPVWTVQGVVHRGKWNYKRYFFLTPIIFGWGAKNYNFTTPEK